MSMTCHHHLRLGARLVSRAVLVPVPRLVIIPRAFVSKYSTTTTTTTITAGSCSIATGLIPPTKPHQCQRTAVNAPASTLPAPLSLPSRDDDPEMSKLTYYFRLGKAYLAFFKAGFRAIYTNYQQTRPIQQALRAAQRSGGGSTAMGRLVESSKITRAQFQHWVRSRHDLQRLPAFGLLFMLCGELSPFVIPFVPSLVPLPCRIPQQLARQRRKEAERRATAFAALPSPPGPAPADGLAKEVSQLDARELAHVAAVLGVHSGPLLLLQPLLPPVVNRWRLARRLDYLSLDDTLLTRGGGVLALDSGEELLMAAQDRGIDTFQRADGQVRDALERYFAFVRGVGGGRVRAGLWLVPPQHWPRPHKA